MFLGGKRFYWKASIAAASIGKLPLESADGMKSSVTRRNNEIIIGPLSFRFSFRFGRASDGGKIGGPLISFIQFLRSQTIGGQ